MAQSGLQRSVIDLYRSLLRAGYAKPPSVRPQIVAYIKKDFKSQAYSVSKKDFGAIEFLIRKGQKRLAEIPLIENIS